MIERTQKRLRQARFFYEHLLNERQQTFRHDPEAFRFYFSAFIQAARTVTWTLKKEEKKKWEAWEPKWRANLSNEEQKLLGITNTLRIAEVHQGGANLPEEFEEVAIDELLTANLDLRRQHPAYGIHVAAPPGVPQPKAYRPVHYFEDEEGKEEISALCLRYLEFLEKMVKGFCDDNQVDE
jgi:hypothetical protein